MSYQAVIRNASNGLVSNTPVGMRISILQGSASGTAVYVETQAPILISRISKHRSWRRRSSFRNFNRINWLTDLTL